MKKTVIIILSVFVFILAAAVLAVNCILTPPADTQISNGIPVSATAPSVDPASIRSIPPYQGNLIIEINDNRPFFSTDEIIPEAYDLYSKLDAFGRAGTARACLGPELLPTEARGSIATIEPTGWQKDSEIYHRCHLIGNQMAGNDSAENLITGTIDLNIKGMLPIENRVAMYVGNTGNHVLYRVTPLYEGSNLVATALEIEAYSVEDQGREISFNVLIYNVQEGYTISYSSGRYVEDNGQQPGVILQLLPGEEDSEAAERMLPGRSESYDDQTISEDEPTYILNTNTMRFHYPYCDSVQDIKDKNKELFYGTREEAIEQGYTPCGRCNP